MSNYVVIGGGWSGTSGTGEKFIRLKFKSTIQSGSTMTMWKNKNRKNEKHPEYIILAVVGNVSVPESPDVIF